jgi:hypothetical protein
MRLRWSRWSALVLLALVVVSAGIAQTGTGHGLLRDVGLYQVPPSYTELAFTDPQALPLQFGSGHVSIPVSFGIHNVSDSSRTYNWSIALVSSGRSRPAAAGVVHTPAQGRATVDRTVETSCAGGRLQVVIRLASPAQSIDFWGTCTPGSRSVR